MKKKSKMIWLSLKKLYYQLIHLRNLRYNQVENKNLAKEYF